MDKRDNIDENDDHNDLDDEGQPDPGRNAVNHSNNNWPSTVDQSVDVLLAEISDADRDLLRSMPNDDLITLHFTWGMGIRNDFGLWSGNEALMQSCGDTRWLHPSR